MTYNFRSLVWSLSYLVIVYLFICAPPISSQTIDRVIFPESAAYLLISYSVQHEMLAENDPTPLVRIYGDGHVLVHRPSYMKQSGDYQMRISKENLQALCQQLINHRIMSFDQRLADDEINARRSPNGQQYAISDHSEVEIIFKPHAVRITPSHKVEPVGSRRHRVRNPRTYAKLFRGAATYQEIAQVEQLLNQLIYAAHLTRLP